MLLGHNQIVVTLRPALARDEPFLREMLAAAADWRSPSGVRSAEEVIRDTAVSHYLLGWPQPRDFGVIAVDRDTPVGAAWCRTFDAELPGYGFVASDVPELTIGVVAGRRGEGIGRLLLEGLIVEAQNRNIKRMSLSVEADNPAMLLYVDIGFVEVSRVADSPTMILDCRKR